MKKKGEKQVEKKEEIAEDWCFDCKDGGLLLVCDYKHCLKSYHAECAGKDESFDEAGDHWICRWHSCLNCKKSSKYHCFCCPRAVCERCIGEIEFACVRGNKGFCNDCLKLALLGEEDMNVDSDGDCVDFKDRDTYECLFYEYWEIIREKEGLTLEHLQSADVQMKKGGKHKSGKQKSGFSSDKSDKEDEFQSMPSSDDDDDDDDDDVVEERKLKHKRKRSNRRQLGMNRFPKSRSEIISWGSKCLMDFLASIGKDTSKRYEQHNVTSIIIGYANENKLFHPEKKRKIVCDEKLKCLLGRKMVDKSKIFDILEPHFPENLETESEEEQEEDKEDEEDEEEEDETECKPKQKDEKIMVSGKKQSNAIANKKSEEKEVLISAPQSCFAFIVAENIKLVYLKKSLVLELLKQPETFEGKVVGSFVRVKLDSGSGSRRYSYQLLQVTGIKKMSIEENITENLLQVSNVSKDVSISMLSDDNFSEEECEDLRRKVKDGLIRKLTIVELEQKARSLHEDITKHWIIKELAILQHRIDRANEKGWRREFCTFFECSERKRQLQKPEVQLRLLQKVPNVIPDLADHDPVAKDAAEEDEQADENSQEPVLVGSSETSGSNEKGSGTSSEEKEDYVCVSMQEAKQNHTTESSILGELPQQSHLVSDVCDSVFLEKEPHQTISQDQQKNCVTSVAEKLVEEKNVPEYQMNAVLQMAEEKKRGYVSSPEAKQNHSTETCILDVLPLQPHVVVPRVQDDILFESELFQNIQK